MFPTDLALSRRAALGLFGATGAAAFAPGIFAQPADGGGAAPAPPQALQGAGFYRFALGSFNLALVSDGGFPFGSGYPLFGRNVNKDDVEACLTEAFVDPTKVMGQVNTFLIQTGKQNILIDTGCGSSFGPGTGKLIGNLANAGVKPEDINALIITHAHPDHINGLADAKGLGLFPNAAFFASKIEHDFWTGPAPDLSKTLVPAEMRQLMTGSAASLFEGLKGKVQLVGDGDTIAPGVKVFLAPGHTPGHLAVHIASGSEQLLYVTDAAHHAGVNLPHPDWYVGYDTDPQIASRSRRALFTKAAGERCLVAGAHLPFPAVGHVKHVKGGGFEWAPKFWEW
jgi:glyoxylase-like metal-dependent hydrolase (beta-lactamase superfamily II)